MNQDERARLTAEAGVTTTADLFALIDVWEKNAVAANRRVEEVEAERDEARRQLAETRAREPSKVGGPGHEETYWLRQKLNASVQHLRDIEDFYRLHGGSELSHNMVRADRARSLYEQITEDFVNGKLSRPTMRERAESAAAERDRLRDALRRARLDATDVGASGWDSTRLERTKEAVARIDAALAESEETT